MRAGLMPAPPADAHSVFALTLSEHLGVAPDPLAWPDLAEPLIFGPMLPSRYRLQGPGAQHDAPDRFRRLLASAPRPEVDPADLEALERFRTGSRSL
jgi:dimethylaniline monooxygenase (N-oxide forming)